MTAYLNLWKDGNRLQTIALESFETRDSDTFFNLEIERIPGLTPIDEEQTRRRRRNRRLIDRIGDPEHGFPILRQLIQKFAPILIEYLMRQLPVWLADVEDLEQDQQTA